ncbi:MAG: M56 family metallopeptidase [Oscillospiraceae bacterium]|nr:M56 family metallopeptidase [Oscillospiraceae bacterium]
MITQLFSMVLALSLTGSAIYLLAKPVLLICGKHLSQGWRYRCAFAQMLLFALPLHRLWWSLPQLPSSVPTVTAVSTAPVPAAVHVDVPLTPQMPTALSFPWEAVLKGAGILWSAIVCGLFMWELFCFLRFRRQCAQAVPVVDHHLAAMAQALAARLGIRGKVRLMVAPWSRSPMLIGFFQPLILLPNTALSSQEMEFILSHELTHYLRGDLWKKLVLEAVRGIHWFNPFVHLLARDLNRWIETSCDEAVVSSLDMAGRKEYGRLLINLSQPSRSGVSGVFTPFASPRESLERRIITMLKSSNKSNKVISTLLVFVLICACVSMSAFAAEVDGSIDANIADYGEPMAAVANDGDIVTAGDANPLYEDVVISGEIGDVYVVGDLVFEIISQDEVQAASAESKASASSKLWSIDLSSDAMSKGFKVTSSYPYAKVWVSNTGTGDIKFTITQSSPTGSVVSGSNITIKAGTSTSVYSTNKWPAVTYYANFTCGKADLAGVAACRVASAIEELDV